MRDPRIGIWQVLHDATITVTARETSDVALMFINIPFVRRRIAPLGDSFRLRLGGFRSLEFRWGYEWDTGERTSHRAENETYGLDYIEGMMILGTTSTSMPVEVKMAEGFMTIDFD